MRHKSAIALLLLLAAPQLAQAQPRTPGGNHAVLWTVVGVGSGFGIGLVTGLAAFDDAIDSDRKVWTSAIVGAAVGGAIGYVIGRHHRRGTQASPAAAPSHGRSHAPLAERDVRQLAASFRLGGRQTTQW